MTLERITCTGICIVIASVGAAGQQRTEGTAPQPGTSITERINAAKDIKPWRVVQTRTEANGRERVVETLETPNLDGRMAPIQEIVTETQRSSPTTTLTGREVFGFAGDGRRALLETTASQQDRQPNGEAVAVRTTWVPDVNGRVALASQQIERTRPVGSNGGETSTTVLVPHDNVALREIERIDSAERRTSPTVFRSDSTHQLRDINGRWQPAETRAGEVRDISPSEQVEDETVQRADVNGKLTVTERIVTRRSMTNGREDVLIETYAPNADGRFRGSDLALSQRVHRTTATAADGGSSLTEEVEGRSLVSPAEPLRVVRRTESTTRPSGTNSLVTERRVFERDPNGRLQLVATETEQRPKN